MEKDARKRRYKLERWSNEKRWEERRRKSC